MSEQQSEPEFVYGVRSIAKAIDDEPRATAHMLRKGIPGAAKLHGRWVLNTKIYRSHFEGVAA
jgi:hypothetical protein